MDSPCGVRGLPTAPRPKLTFFGWQHGNVLTVYHHAGYQLLLSCRIAAILAIEKAVGVNDLFSLNDQFRNLDLAFFLPLDDVKNAIV